MGARCVNSVLLGTWGAHTKPARFKKGAMHRCGRTRMAKLLRTGRRSPPTLSPVARGLRRCVSSSPHASYLKAYFIALSLPLAAGDAQGRGPPSGRRCSGCCCTTAPPPQYVATMRTVRKIKPSGEALGTGRDAHIPTESPAWTGGTGRGAASSREAELIAGSTCIYMRYDCLLSPYYRRRGHRTLPCLCARLPAGRSLRRAPVPWHGLARRRAWRPPSPHTQQSSSNSSSTRSHARPRRPLSGSMLVAAAAAEAAAAVVAATPSPNVQTRASARTA